VGGGMDTYILLPAGGRWSHSCELLPASGRGFAFAKQGNKMRRLRRRNHEWAEEWLEGLQTICTITMSVRG
jgi:hypothetical protein